MPEDDMLEAELLPVVTIELPDIDTQVFGRCFTEPFGDMLLSPRNLMAWKVPKVTENFERFGGGTWI